MEVRNCPSCLRDFLPSTCPDHCGPVCCRKMLCYNAKPARSSQRYSMMVQKRCRVCGAHGDWFQKFAPCVPKSTPAYGPPGCERYKQPTAYGGWQWSCTEHRPEEKERYHIEYCSLKCYNSWRFGHRERMRTKWRRHGRKTGRSRYQYRKALQEAGGKLY